MVLDGAPHYNSSW